MASQTTNTNGNTTVTNSGLQVGRLYIDQYNERNNPFSNANIPEGNGVVTKDDIKAIISSISDSFANFIDIQRAYLDSEKANDSSSANGGESQELSQNTTQNQENAEKSENISTEISNNKSSEKSVLDTLSESTETDTSKKDEKSSDLELHSRQNSGIIYTNDNIKNFDSNKKEDYTINEYRVSNSSISEKLTETPSSEEENIKSSNTSTFEPSVTDSKTIIIEKQIPSESTNNTPSLNTETVISNSSYTNNEIIQESDNNGLIEPVNVTSSNNDLNSSLKPNQVHSSSEDEEPKTIIEKSSVSSLASEIKKTDNQTPSVIDSIKSSFGSLFSSITKKSEEKSEDNSSSSKSPISDNSSNEDKTPSVTNEENIVSNSSISNFFNSIKEKDNDVKKADVEVLTPNGFISNPVVEQENLNSESDDYDEDDFYDLISNPFNVEEIEDSISNKISENENIEAVETTNVNDASVQILQQIADSISELNKSLSDNTHEIINSLDEHTSSLNEKIDSISNNGGDNITVVNTSDSSQFNTERIG